MFFDICILKTTSLAYSMPFIAFSPSFPNTRTRQNSRRHLFPNLVDSSQYPFSGNSVLSLLKALSSMMSSSSLNTTPFPVHVVLQILSPRSSLPPILALFLYPEHSQVRESILGERLLLLPRQMLKLFGNYPRT